MVSYSSMSGLSGKMKNNITNKLKAIDFFCDTGGVTYGISQSGIKVMAGIDNNPNCRDTYEINNKESIFIENHVERGNSFGKR